MLTPSIIRTDLTCMSSRTEESNRLEKICSYLNRGDVKLHDINPSCDVAYRHFFLLKNNVNKFVSAMLVIFYIVTTHDSGVSSAS